jgi:alpha-ribazole phosphatase
MAMKLILIRHGETLWNAQKRYCGSTDIGLSAKGKKQARRLKEKLNGTSVHKIYTSGRKRAIQTAKIIFQGAKINNMPDLNETHFGIFEGLTYGEIVKKHPKLYKSWLGNPTEVKIPGAEEIKQFCLRVRESLSLILSRHQNESIVVITHGGPIRVILCDALKYNLKDFWQIEQDIGALNIIEYSEELEPRVIKMNDTSHLLIKKSANL